MVGWQLSFVDDGHNNKKQHDPRLIYSGIYLPLFSFCVYKKYHTHYANEGTSNTYRIEIEYRLGKDVMIYSQYHFKK